MWFSNWKQKCYDMQADISSSAETVVLHIRFYQKLSYPPAKSQRIIKFMTCHICAYGVVYPAFTIYCYQAMNKQEKLTKMLVGRFDH